MANVIDIEIKATDKTKGAISDIKGALGDLEGGFEDLTGISLSTAGMFALAGTAVSAVVDYTKEAVTETIKYATEVETLARITGQSFEDASRLIQVAESMGISYKDLATGLGNATKKGVDVSIENLLLLADEYNKLETPIDKAKWLTENFGAAGTDLAPLFEASSARIITAMDDVNEALVLDQEAITSISDYETAVADLEDSFDALEVKVGTRIIPLLLGLLDVLNNEEGARGTGFQRMFGEIDTAADTTVTKVENVKTGFERMFGGIDESATTSVGKVEEVADAIDSLHDKTVTITVITQEQNSYGEGGYIGYLENNAGVDMNGNGIIGMATGGYAAGGPFLVGERGPELFTPSGGGQIIPNNQLGGGGMSQSQMTQFAQIMSVALAAEVQKLTG